MKKRIDGEMKAPRINSEGPPPDKHAERIVDEMLRYMHLQRTLMHTKYGHSLIDVRTMGAPAGQMKTVEKMRKAIGPLLLDISLLRAKRGKFILMATEWILWDAKAQQPIPSGATLPPGPLWLAVTSSTYTGTNYIPKVTTGLALVISKHTLARFCQRAGVVSVGDMILAVRKLWYAVDHLMSRFEPKSSDWLRPPQPYDAWLLALEIEGTPVAVIARPTRSSATC